MNVQMGLEVKLYSCFNLGVKCGVVVSSMPRLLYPKERHLAPTAQKVGWAQTGHL